MTERATQPAMYLLFAGVAGLAIGPFLPWMQATIPFAGTISRTGVDNGGDGMLVVIGAVALGIVAVFALQGRSRRTTSVVAIIVGAISGALVAYDAHDISDRFASVKSGAGANLISTSYGAGLFLSGLGAVLAFIAGCMLLTAGTDRMTLASETAVGLRCPEGHDNPKDARHCMTCGTKSLTPF